MVGPSLALDIVYAGLNMQPDLLVVNEEEQDTNGDGVIDRRSRTKIAANGLQISTERDTDLDGVYEPIGITNLDRNGHWTGNTSVSPDGMALPPDDVYHYDENGYVLSVGQGNPAIWRVQITNDPDGLHALEQTDTNNNGVFDSSVAITYDSVGRLVQTERDTDMDGVANQRATYLYDELGRVHVSENGSSLQGPNPYQFRYTTAYSAGGLDITTESINLNNPSMPSRGGRRHDAMGNRLESYWIDPTTGAEQLVEKSTYRDDGKRLSQAFLSNGTATWRTTVLSYQLVSHWAELGTFLEFSEPAPPSPPAPAPGGGMGGGMGGGGGGGGGM